MTTCKFHAPESDAIREIKSWHLTGLWDSLLSSVVRISGDEYTEARHQISLGMDSTKRARSDATVGDCWGLLGNVIRALAVTAWREQQECEGEYDQSLPCAGAAASRA